MGASYCFCARQYVSGDHSHHVPNKDRSVVTSVGGKLVSTDRVNVFQSLDPSIIKSINVHEGDEVKAGQVLATLDPTFAAADVKQLKQQVASLRAQTCETRRN